MMHIVEKAFVSLVISAISKPAACGEPMALFPLIFSNNNNNLYSLADLSLLNIPGANATAQLILGIF